MLAFVWGLAVLGIVLDTFITKRIEILQILIYLLMGWVCTLEYGNLMVSIGTAGMVWLTIGGVVYTIGVVFYVLDDRNKLHHAHGIWHIFVLMGSISHFISIVGYVR
jgi:hemolysin III